MNKIEYSVQCIEKVQIEVFKKSFNFEIIFPQYLDNEKPNRLGGL